MSEISFLDLSEMQLIPVTMLAYASFWLDPSEVEALVGVRGK